MAAVLTWMSSRIGLPETVPAQILVLLATVASGAATYGITLIGLWKLSGSPPGAEKMVLDVVGQKLGARFGRGPTATS